MSANEIPPDAPSPRLCHLIKWPDFDGYGFNLHAEKSKPGQFIGKVDEGSPAEAAGLRTADRIIEVNGVNIANENHKQVVERIKAVLNETKLLVVDDETDRWYKERKLVIKGTQPNVKYLKTPDTRLQNASNHSSNSNLQDALEVDDDNESFKSVEQISQNNSKTPSAAGSTASTPSFGRKENDVGYSVQPKEKLEEEKKEEIKEEVHEKDEVINNSNSFVKNDANANGSPQKKESSPKVAREVANAQKKENSPKVAREVANAQKKENSPKVAHEVANGTSSAGSQASSVNSGDKLNLNMSVQEMREMLASRKKHDPKKDAMDFRQKYAIIQDM